MIDTGYSNKVSIQWVQAQLAATHLRRDKQLVLTVRPELVEGSFMVRQAHYERLTLTPLFALWERNLLNFKEFDFEQSC